MLLLVLLLPATVALDVSGCNDGSTGCCKTICPECACNNSCVSCSTRCTLPKGCACSSGNPLTAAELMSVPSDAAARD